MIRAMSSPDIKTNVILIGMPGSGKSTLGVQLAKCLGLNFVDTDLLIQTQQGRQLQDIIDDQGYQALRQIEEHILQNIQLKNTVIATGGSVVYSQKAMQHLKSLGLVVFLEVELAILNKRVNNETSRGIARPKGQTFTDVYNERTPLYDLYADIIYNNNENKGDVDSLVTSIYQYQLLQT